jgi:hypothetical protein
MVSRSIIWLRVLAHSRRTLRAGDLTIGAHPMKMFSPSPRGWPGGTVAVPGKPRARPEIPC